MALKRSQRLVDKRAPTMDDDDILNELEETQIRELAVTVYWLKDHPNQVLVDALVDALAMCHTLGRRGAALQQRKLSGTRTPSECIEAMSVAAQALDQVKRVHTLLRLLRDGKVCLHSSTIH